jgi:putative hydrolase of HD superfamily
MPKRADLKAIANFIYETGMLSKTPRSGLWFLGTGQQSVAEHTLRTAFIGYALASLTPEADRNKVIFICLFHDLGEGRTSDLNYVHQRYGRLAEARAIEDISKSVPFGNEIKNAYDAFEARETLEAKISKDADQLEWLATMLEEESKGNTKARAWAENAYKRLKTPAGQHVGKMLIETEPDAWWLDINDPWFVDRKEEDRKWRTSKR